MTVESAHVETPPSDSCQMAYATNLVTLYHVDCFEWLRAAPEASITGIVTDPPTGSSSIKTEFASRA